MSVCRHWGCNFCNLSVCGHLKDYEVGLLGVGCDMRVCRHWASVLIMLYAQGTHPWAAHAADIFSQMGLDVAPCRVGL
jgi:hypothetical protein